MTMRIFGLILAIILSVLPIKAQKTGSNKPKPEIPTVSFCELLLNPECYDGKRVKFRAKYLSTFEVSAFIDAHCTDNNNRVWVEFDRTSISISTKPEVFQKIEEQVYCCLLGGLSFMRETEMLVEGIFHKPKKQGYGHDNDYRFMVTIKSIEEIGDTEKIQVPGFDQSP